jgi:ribose 5-phosphate isomerase B
MEIVIGCTKAGLVLKEAIIAHLESKGYQVNDVGMKKDGEFVPYYTAAANVASLVGSGKYEKGIIICGTGAGSVIVANKFKGVYAVQTSSEFEASRAAAINEANVLCLGEWITPDKHAVSILDSWLETKPGQGFEPQWQEFLHNGCLEVQNIESQNLK